MKKLDIHLHLYGTDEEKRMATQGSKPLILSQLQEKTEPTVAPKTILTDETFDLYEDRPEDERSFYDLDSEKSQYGIALKDGLQKIKEHWDLPDAEVAKMRRGAARVFDEVGIEPRDAGVLHSLFVQYTNDPPDEEVVKGWEKETQEMLEQNFRRDAQERLEIAQEFIAKRPQLAQGLNFTGLGSHPKVVQAIAERAWAIRAKSRKGKADEKKKD